MFYIRVVVRNQATIICNKEQTNVEQSEEESEQESSDNENDAEETRIVLPNHIRCASHTLSLLASSDFEKSIQSNSVYKLAYKRVLSKLKSLWNKNSKSVIASDATFEILGRYLPRPVETRWNSLFDSVRTLASQNPDKINELLVKLKIPTVSNSENAFLRVFNHIGPYSHFVRYTSGREKLFFRVRAATIGKT